MINLQVNFNQKDVKQIDRVIGGIESELTDLTELFLTIQPMIAAAIKDNFDKGGNWRGAWTPLSKAYAEWKAAEGHGTRILNLTGALEKAATEKGATHNLCAITPSQMVWGVAGSLPYASRHDRGDQGGTPMPQREYMILNAEVMNEVITRAIADFVRKSPNLSSGTINPR